MNNKILVILYLLCLWVPNISCAEPATTYQSSNPTSAVSKPIPYKKEEGVGAQLFQVGFTFIFVIAIAIALLYAYKRLLISQRAIGRRMQIIETLRLTPRTALFLVKLDNQCILVGQQGDALSILISPVGEDPSTALKPNHTDES